MKQYQKILIAGGVLLSAVSFAALTVQPQNKVMFPYKEAADPKLVVESYQGGGSLAPPAGNGGGGGEGGGGGMGSTVYPRGVNDPVFPVMELLGRPTDTTITINAAPAKDVDAYYEYGTKSGVYTDKTASTRYRAGEPFNVRLTQLKPNTQYYYRMRYRDADTTNEYLTRAEHSFHTARPPGSTFTFVAQFDPHLGGDSNMEAYRLTLKKMLADKPDFMFDLGDNFQIDRLRPPTKPGVLDRTLLLRSYYDLINHSVPLYLAIGNHEGEWARNLDGTPDNMAIWMTQARKQYFPNPEPNGFYSGGATPEPIVGLRQSYYSWQWGDAQFIVVDPYWYKPIAPEQAGDWWTTLGKEQYDWLKKTLETSKASYKFLFSHNLIGGLDMRGMMRGGIETVKYLEMGGYNLDGTWGFDKARPGWAMPIHPMLVQNNATIWFHGHDHLYAKQDLDGMVYQEGPMPAREGRFDAGPTSKSYNYLHGTVLGGSGYIRVRVSPQDVKVDYVQTYLPKEEDATHKDGMIADSYTIKARKQNPKLQ